MDHRVHLRLASAVFAYALSASTLGGEYWNPHRFILTPAGEIPPVVRGHYYEHTYTVQKNVVADEDWNPAQPGAGAGNRDRLVRTAKGFEIRNGNAAMTPGTVPITNAGINAVYTATSGPTQTVCTANSRINIPAFAGKSVAGTIVSDGSVKLGPQYPAHGWAFSYTDVTARSGWRNKDGTIRWGPESVTMVAGKMYDPIMFRIFDDQETLLDEGMLFWSVAEVGPLGSFLWGSNQLHLQVPDSMHFEIDIPGSYTAQSGRIAFTVEDGKIATAEDSGLFDGLLPAVGTSTDDLLISMPNDFTLDYHIPMAEDDRLSLDLEFSNAGSRFEAVPEPTTLLALGLALSLAVRRRR